MRHKWFKLDAETWLSDPKLRLVSATARGLWIDVICLCHISEKYGFLVLSGTKLGPNELQKILKWSKSETKKFQELIQFDIIKQDNEGYYYCKKLLKDKYFREQQAEYGRRGGNPTLKGKDNEGDNEGDNPYYKDIDIEGEGDSSPFSVKLEEDIQTFVDCCEKSSQLVRDQTPEPVREYIFSVLKKDWVSFSRNLDEDEMKFAVIRFRKWISQKMALASN